MTARLIEHEEFCLPRPGYDNPRVEQYVQSVDVEGQAPRRILTVRCQECGGTNYTEA